MLILHSIVMHSVHLTHTRINTYTITYPRTAAKGQATIDPAATPATAVAQFPDNQPAIASIVVLAQNAEGRNAAQEMNWPAEHNDTARKIRPALDPKWLTIALAGGGRGGVIGVEGCMIWGGGKEEGKGGVGWVRWGE